MLARSSSLTLSECIQISGAWTQTLLLLEAREQPELKLNLFLPGSELGRITVLEASDVAVVTLADARVCARQMQSDLY